MTKRSYRQYCPIAHALDLLGERWTLLVVRDLLMGPLRYGDLLAGLPGLSTDLLADRLRALEEHGVVVRRRLAPPAGSTVYELTEAGEGLREVIDGLARWGGGLMPPVGDTDDRIDHRWALLSMAAGCRAPADRTETYQLVIDGEPFALVVEAGRARAVRGEVAAPAVTVRAAPEAFLALAAGALGPAPEAAALAAGGIEVEGDRAALGRMVAGLGLAFTAAAP